MSGNGSRAQASRALLGIAAAVAAALLCGLVSEIAQLLRCGGWFGDYWSVPDTLSADLCGNRGLTDALTLVASASPLVAGLVGTALALTQGRTRALTWGLVVGVIPAAAIVLTYAVSGFVPT